MKEASWLHLAGQNSSYFYHAREDRDLFCLRVYFKQLYLLMDSLGALLVDGFITMTKDNSKWTIAFKEI